MTVSPIPEGFHTITAQLNLEQAAEAIDFYKAAFGAKEIDRALDGSGKKIMHAHLQIGSSALFVNHVFTEMDPEARQSQSELWMYVEDVDAAFKRAVDAGAKPGMPPSDMFWGDRMGTFRDPFGQRWTVATRTKNMTPDEMKAAHDAFLEQMKKHG